MLHVKYILIEKKEEKYSLSCSFQNGNQREIRSSVTLGKPKGKNSMVSQNCLFSMTVHTQTIINIVP